jgi:O-antigen ligase
MKNKHSFSQKNQPSRLFLIGVFLILALPLLNVPPWFSPPDWGKTIIFRIINSILIFLFVYQFLSRPKNIFLANDKKEISHSLAFRALIALFAIFLLATLFSVDINFSLWGNPYRSGGFVNFAFYIIFAVLLLFTLGESDWQKVWDFSIFIGILVSVVALFQQFGIFNNFFLYKPTQLPGTVGGPIFLGIYLMLLSPLTLAFGIGEKKLIKRIFYFLSFLLFLIIIVLTISQAAYLGIAAGMIYFFFAFPLNLVSAPKNAKKLKLLKFTAGSLLILGILAILFLKTHPEISQNQNYIINNLISWKIDQSRISAWKISWQALKARPLFGYGPENFSIGFDRYYDPSLPDIEKTPFTDVVTTWWDRAHSFIFDIGVTAGLPALVIYLLLFGILFWQLEKLKNYPRKPATAASSNQNISENHPAAPRTEGERISLNQRIIAHSIQATFIGYFVANFFSFDTFSSYLISFLLIGYSLHLTAESNADSKAEDKLNSASNQRSALTQPKNQREFSDKTLTKRIYSMFLRQRKPILIFLLIILVWFIWQYNIRPFQINTQINIAKYLSENGKCKLALERMKNVLPEKSILDTYLRLKYITYLKNCEPAMPEKTLEFAKLGYGMLKESLKIQPYYTRNWILIGNFVTILISRETDAKIRQDLIKEADSYFEKAKSLSPKRQEVLTDWAKMKTISGQYQEAIEKANECIKLNSNLGECYWVKAVPEIYLEEFPESERDLKLAEEKGYRVNSPASIDQLIIAYSSVKNYQKLVPIYQNLIEWNSSNPQYHASLALAYREMGEFEKARQEALIFLKLMPEAKEEVELFLKTLPR